jgi:hypothetical protein
MHHAIIALVALTLASLLCVACGGPRLGGWSGKMQRVEEGSEEL